MSPVEELLTRTLRDPGRALPLPAEPVAAIRQRARVQRRNTAVGLAVVLLVVAATLLVPVTVARFTRPAPVATDPAPHGSGLLEWPISGPLAGDTQLVQDAAQRWRRALQRPTGTVRLLWAGRVGAARVVVLQAPGPDGQPMLAEVADRDGRLAVLRTEPIADAGISALRLVDPAVDGPDRALLLTRPGSTAVQLLIGTGVTDDVPVGGVLAEKGVVDGMPIAVLDRDGRVLGDGVVPPPGRLALTRGDVRLTTARWDRGRLHPPAADDYDGGRVLGAMLDPSWSQPVEVGPIENVGTLTLQSGRAATPTFYELHRAGRTYLGWIVWIGDRPFCQHLDDVTDTGGQADALLLRCALPQDHTGLVWVHLHNGIRLAGLRVDAARPGEGAIAETFRSPLDSGTFVIQDTLPTGPAQLRVEDISGQPRPTLRLPAYHP